MPFKKTNSVKFSKPTSVLPYETQNLNDLYTLGIKLGQGQYGTTYLCIENSTGAKYACKSIPKRKLVCREDCDDVCREIQIMHHLVDHPNVVTIKGTYEDSSHVHLVMELCEGGELFDRIVAKGQYSEREAAQLMKTIIGVIEVCHSSGVIHRDLKPENFLFESIAEDSALKATDFGLSVFYQPDVDESGTIDYTEFVAATLHLNKLEREENLASAFAYFDKDGSGYITIDELQQACKELGLSDQHLEEMIKEIDQDDDGQIDYKEFVAMMRMGNGGGGRRTMRSIINLEEAVESLVVS